MLKKWFCLILFLSSNSTIGQDRFYAYDQIVQEFSGDLLIFKVDSLLEAYERVNDFVAQTKITHKFVGYHYNNGDLHRALEYSLKEIRAFEDANVNDKDYADALYHTGRLYYWNAQYQQAKVIYNRIVGLNIDDVSVGNAYAEIGRCYDILGDFYNAVAFLEKGLKLLASQKEFVDYSIHSINLANSYGNINTEESRKKQLLVLQKAKGLANTEDIGSRNYLNLVDAIANWYNSTYNYDFEKAQSYYIENLKEAHNTQDSVVIARTYNNLSNLYNFEKNDSAAVFVKMGLSFGGSKNTQARLYDNKSEYYILNKELDLALESIHKALEVNLGITLDIGEMPTEYALSQSNFKTYSLFCLRKKIEVLLRLYQQTKNKAYLTNAFQNSTAADLLIDIIQDDASESRSKLLWRSQASSVYLHGAHIARLLNDPESIFFFMEKNKALLLAEEIFRNTSFSALPKDEYNTKNLLKKEISDLERALEMTKNEQSMDQLKDSLFNAKLGYEKFLEYVESEYPGYFQNRPHVRPITLLQVQRGIKEHEVLISFIWNKLYNGNEQMIGLATNASQSHVFQIEVDGEFLTLLNKYTQLVSKPFETNEDKTSFQQVSAKLFNRLFPDAEVKEILAGKNLKIITDGDLQNISFDALIPDASTNRYLVESSNIDYLYSVSFLNYNENVERSPRDRFIGYAPVSFNDSQLALLTNTEEEIKSVNEIVNGVTELNGDATKSHFMKNSGNYKIVHLATHASEENNPWISFADERLELRELFNHKLNADLVVLSACNTSLGEVAEGEGVLSLTRGFFHAGANSVVSSLWNVDDKSSQYIMSKFYANLYAGQLKSEALSNAKRSYLKDHSLSEQSPYYWSAFILVGNDEPISFSTDKVWYIAGLLTAILFLIIFFKKKSFR